MANLVFKNINKIYPNNVQAVFDFNLEIKDKEFIVFVGPSGCGKSTTLRMVAGLEDITAGELYIDNVLVNQVAPKDRNIAMVFQNYALYPHMSVYGNMSFALKIRRFNLPLFEQNEESILLEKENQNIYSQIKALYRKSKKKQNEEILKEIEDLHNQIFENEKKIEILCKPVMGINEHLIADLEKKLKSAEESLAKYQKYYDKGGYTEKATKMLEDGIEQKKILINSLNNQIEYYKNNETQLTSLRKFTKLEIDSEIYKAALILGLTEYLFRKPAALSGGQRQRVALGRTIVRRPKVYLMDEPLSNLDAKLRVQTRSEITKIHRQVGATTIYVTHDQTEAMTMADRIVVMKGGYVQQIGTPEEIYEKPANTFVAAFIGNPAMNFLKAKFDGKDLSLVDENKEPLLKLELSETMIDVLKKNNKEDIVFGIRPEAVSVTQNSQDKNTLKVLCDDRELLGHESVLYTYIAGQKFLSKVSSALKIKAGDMFNIKFEDENIYLFDEETGLNLFMEQKEE